MNGGQSILSLKYTVSNAYIPEAPVLNLKAETPRSLPAGRRQFRPEWREWVERQ